MFFPIWLALQSLAAAENCPSLADVDARVHVILHLPSEQAISERFVVERHEAGLYVELRSADSTLIGERTLPAQGSCDELAQAAAVILSAWLSDVHPDFAGALPDPGAAPRPEPEPPVPRPEPKPKPASVRKRVSPLRAASHSLRGWELGLGLGSDLTGGRFTLALPLTVGYGPVASGLGLGAMTIATPSRQSSLPPGLVSWRRWPLGVGPNLRLASPRLVWDFNPGVAVGWLHVAGSNFSQTSQKDGAEFGGYFNVRVSSRGRRWGFFGLADAQFYPIKADAYVTGIASVWPVPSLSLMLALGVDLSP